MDKKMINGIEVFVNGTVTEGEILYAIAETQKEIKKDETLESLTITEAGENLILDWVVKPMPFERIRRITGYLVGTIDRWNNAKRAEEHDRVKHSLAQ